MENKFTITPYLVITFLSVIILVIQGSFLSFYLPNWMVPDLLLIMVICLSFLWGEKKGLAVGLLTGLLQDIFFGPALGFFALSKMTVAYLAGLVSREIYKDQIIGPMLAAFFGTMVHELIVYFLVGLFWVNELGLYLAVERLFLPRAIYHFILTLLIYPLIYRAELKKMFYPSFK